MSLDLEPAVQTNIKTLRILRHFFVKIKSWNLLHTKIHKDKLGRQISARRNHLTLTGRYMISKITTNQY